MAENKKLIYIVDDDAGIRDVMDIILEDKGFDVKLFADESSFLSTIKNVLPDLIFLDLRIGGSAGEEITKKLKKDLRTENVPVVIMSAMTETRDIARNAGSDGFLEKPFEIDNLIKIVEKHIKS